MDRYLAAREALISGGPPGLDSARRLSALTDDLLASLAGASKHAPSSPWALLALGGYGSETLLPTSDIDLLVVSRTSPNDLKPFVESLLYPLWDAGVQVGHQVRSPRDHRAAARNDLSIMTATLTGRVLAGDAAFGKAVSDACLNDARSRSRILVRELGVRDRPGSPYLLEPDLKSGAGGRRDYDELVWTAAVLTGARQTTPHPLVDLGLLLDWEFGLVETAAALTAAVRWEIAGSRNTSRLTLDAAQGMGADAEMLQRALADTAHVLDRVRRRIAAGAKSASGTPRSSAMTAVEVFATLEGEDDGSVTAALQEAAWLGGLEELVPGFKALMTLRRPALTHELTVGAHSIRCCALCARSSLPESSVLARSRTSIADLRPLLVAALTHDLGKRDTFDAQDGSDAGAFDHAERGKAPALESARRFGLVGQARSDVGELVRLHLVLTDVATRDDLDSEDVIFSAATRIGRASLLPALHVLTVADALATGSGSWGPWQDALVSTLVSRLDAALSADVDALGVAERGDATRAEVLSLLSSGPATASEFVRGAPLRYLASREPTQVASHALLVAELPSHPHFPVARLGVRPCEPAGAFEVAVAAHDHPELFARITGALTLAGLDILAAEAYATASNVVLNVFTVRSATLAPIGHETWQRAERYLRAALADRLGLESRLAERREHYDSRAGSGVEGRVAIDTSAGYDTAVSVTAADRVGLLYDIARAISSTGLRIRWAKALTIEGTARDTFHVVGADGQAPTDAGVLGHISMRIREQL